MQKPLVAIAVALGLALLAPGALAPAQASAEPVSSLTSALSGQVTDALGGALEGVEILVVDDGGGLLPLARATTDPRGRFRLPRLDPGTYRFAAVKDGYRTAVGELDTTARRVLDLVLSPLPDTEAALARLPGDDAWVLRVPRRHIFRETEPGAPVASAARGDGDAPVSALADSLSMQLRHLMAVDGSGPVTAGGEAGSAPGSETLLRVASNLGERGQLSLTGLRDSRGDALDVGESVRSADRVARAFALDFSYATGADSELQMRAFYRRQDLHWSAPDAGSGIAPEDPALQAERAWGYASRWSMQLDPVSRVDVSLDVQNHSLDAGALGVSDPTGDTLLLQDLKSGLSQRAVRAAGSYRSAAVTGHQLQVGLHAQLLDVPAVRLDPATSAPVALADGALGWTVLLDAEDRWTVSAPFTLVYGLGYKHVVDPVDTSLLVPRLGGTLNLAPVVVDFDVSYHAVSAWEDDPSLAVWSSPMAADRAVGWSAEVQVPLGREVSVRASHRRDPVQLDPGVTSWQPSLWMDRPLYRTDGNADVFENRLVLARDAGGTRTYLELGAGEAEGMVNPVRPFHDGFELLTPSSLRFANGRFGVRVAPSGTDVRLGFSRVEELRAVPAAGADLDRVRDAVELRILQDLLRFESLGQWRLLMAFRLESVEDERGAEEAEDGPPRLSAENRGVSAGLSVTF